MPAVEVRPARREAKLAISVPGDKSISHRAVLMNAIARGTATVRNLGPGNDVLSSIGCMRQLGVEIAREADAYRITGEGLQGLRESRPPLDCGNSGTTTRLLAGILAGQPFTSILVGDQSLSRRPMDRVAAPLTQMGASVSGDTLPMTIHGGRLHGIEYHPPIASAQVKSCVLLAALLADSRTILVERVATRDHTERLLRAQGVRLDVEGTAITLHPPEELRAIDIEVPGDMSSAAFWIVAAIILPGVEVTVTNVGINVSRTGLLDVLQEMGADIQLTNQRDVGGEPVADIVTRSSELRGVSLGGDIIPRLIDEVPILGVAAMFAQGTTTIRDAAELRVKESDRIAEVCRGLSSLGVSVEELPDGLIVHGGATHLEPAVLDPHGDHRMAMSWAIAGLRSTGTCRVEDAQSASVSYPGFWDELARFQEASDA
ncbi:MAG: 3-phosphoshikimate 1-carboxyvinyltransferase [Chloroflexi bacterium]|nr:3-phosphoshikimate 1-carboxyvinyltransferase [Chloroflexota bacterium]